jgi:methionyl-tRNA formyltransferase
MRIAFLGSKALGLSMLKALFQPSDSWTVLHPDDHQDARSCLPAFNQFCDDTGLDLSVVVRQSEADAIIRDFQPEVAIVCGWYWILKEEALAQVPLGYWGIHNSLLPKYRGASPLVWAMINGEREVGSTVFRFTPGIDDGPILHQVKVDSDDNDQHADVLDRIEKKLLAELPSRFRAMVERRAALKIQDESAATYVKQRKPEHGLIDWSQPAPVVHNFIRAQSAPYPGAFFNSNQAKVTVWKSERLDLNQNGIPGEPLEVSSHYAIVSCGEGTILKISHMEVEGQSRSPLQIYGGSKGHPAASAREAVLLSV